jgi:hypothetical protein
MADMTDPTQEASSFNLAGSLIDPMSRSNPALCEGRIRDSACGARSARCSHCASRSYTECERSVYIMQATLLHQHLVQCTMDLGSNSQRPTVAT